MTLEQRLQWITLPAGPTDDGTALRLSVFVAPQLRTDEAATIAPFPDLLDWPARIVAPGTAFELELSNGGPVPVTRTGADPDPSLWRALFDAGTALRPFAFDDHADRPIVTFSSDRVLLALRRIYTAVAAVAPEGLPTALGHERTPGLVDLFDEVRAVHRRSILGEGVASGAELDGRITDLLAGARAEAARRRSDPTRRGGAPIEPLPADGTATGEFARLLLFHRRPGEPVDLPPDEAAAARHFAEAVDFHERLAALGDHPPLLRRLGLVIDFTVPVEEVPDTGPFEVAGMRIRPTWESLLPAGQHADVTMWTAYRHVDHGGERFFAVPHRMPDPAAPPTAPPIGLLPLPDGVFTVEQVDVDGAGLKALNLAATLDRVAGRTGPSDVPVGEPDGLGVPSLRSSGLALTHRGRAGALQGGFLDQLRLRRATEAGARPWLWAEDVTRGYRLDVWDDAAGRWASLHERTVTYAVSGLATDPPPVDDEGMFQPSLAEAPPAAATAPDPATEVYVHERVVTWDGWSLAASRPGKDLGPEVPERNGHGPLTAMGLSIETAARPGTLPRLRFGRGYRLRVRMVDLAGNGPTVAEADRRLALVGTDTPVVPVRDSAAYLRFEPVPPPVLVPRAEFDEGASLLRLVVRSDVDRTPGEYAEGFNASADVLGGGHAPLRPYDERHVAPPKASLQLFELHGLLDRVIGSDGGAPDPEHRARIQAMYEIARREEGTFDDPAAPGARVVEIEGDAELRQHYVCHDVDELVVPYLPDPLAAGVVFHGLPGVADGEPYRVNVQGGYQHEGRAFRLRLTGGDGPPVFDEDARVLTVSLPQAASASVLVSSEFSGDLEQMGIVRWCLETLDSDEADRVIAAARGDRCWLLTPWREIALVHAVQRPLSAPLVDSFELIRNRGEITADFYAFVTLHVPSTERIDLIASWSETVDDTAESEPRRRDAAATVFSLPLAGAEAYADWGPPDAPFMLQDHQDDGHAVLSFNTPVARGRELDTPASHGFGDTRHRAVTYRVRAATPFREYFPPAWADDPDRLSLTSEPVPVAVPSSAPPAAPHVLGVVPTLGWEEEAADPPVRRRRGGGLRVWLDRPWFSSGDGELLGVVIGFSLPAPQSAHYPYVTLVARDPVRAGAPLEFATRATFVKPATVARARLLEVDEGVDLACYAPTFDEGTGRWFCDIDLVTGEAYFPFVRLALVRYQEHALRDCHVSPVVLADVVQTLPDRTLTVTRTGGSPGGLQLTLSGPSYTAIRGPGGVRSDDAALGRVFVTIEHRDPRIADDELGWLPLDGSAVELVRTADGTSATWTGNVDVTGHDPATSRIRVVEHDHLAADAEVAGPDGLVARVVYADFVTW